MLRTINSYSDWPLTTRYGYNPVGSLDWIKYANGNYTKCTYDELNRLTEMVNYRIEMQNVMSSFDYTHYADGQRASVTEADGTEINWTYDNLNRLSQEQVIGSYTDVYAYDLAGSRRSVTKDGATTYYFYDDKDQLKKETSDPEGINVLVSYQYDDNGSLTQKAVTGGATTIYTYNLQNRLYSITVGSNPTVTYKYNPDGIRVEKKVGGGNPIKYLIDPYNHTSYAQVFKETQTGQPDLAYIIGNDVLAQATGSANPVYLLYDGHGSVRFLANNQGALISGQVFNYDAFGNIINAVTPQTNLLYSGEWRDLHTDLDYLRNRWYDPSTGIFNQMDDYSGNNYDPQSLHKYLYCHDNPTNRLDPSGEQTYTLTETIGSMTIGQVIVVSLGVTYVTLPPVRNRVNDVAADYAAAGLYEIEYMMCTNAAQIEESLSKISRTIRKTVEELKKQKPFFVFEFATPNIYKFTQSCLAWNPSWYYLTWHGDEARAKANRDWVKATYGYLRKPGYSIDEFPYASTNEGGPPSAIGYAVPARENWIQGGYLRAHYYGILRKPGTKFLVVPVPK